LGGCGTPKKLEAKKYCRTHGAIKKKRSLSTTLLEPSTSFVKKKQSLKKKSGLSTKVAIGDSPHVGRGQNKIA
jgi:hypothetical protein